MSGLCLSRTLQQGVQRCHRGTVGGDDQVVVHQGGRFGVGARVDVVHHQRG